MPSQTWKGGVLELLCATGDATLPRQVLQLPQAKVVCGRFEHFSFAAFIAPTTFTPRALPLETFAKQHDLEDEREVRDKQLLRGALALELLGEAPSHLRHQDCT